MFCFSRFALSDKLWRMCEIVSESAPSNRYFSVWTQRYVVLVIVRDVRSISIVEIPWHVENGWRWTLGVIIIIIIIIKQENDYSDVRQL